jgi:hypothetical protein
MGKPRRMITGREATDLNVGRDRLASDHPACHHRASIVAGALHDVDFMVRDSKRFADTGNWGYAQFNYDEATGAFTPLGTGADFGFACHTIVQGKDYMFTAYPKR